MLDADCAELYIGRYETKTDGLMGRPREFDVDVALESAMRQFWEKGYEGTSLSDLTEAMGITRPSLYATFGNKEALFLKVVDRYSFGHANYIREARRQPTALSVASTLLHAAADALTSPNYPHGCLEMQAALASSTEAAAVRDRLAERRRASEAALRERFERAVQDGELSSREDAADLAKFVMLTAQGMAVQAADGASREELHRMAERALRAWPAA